MSAGCSCASRKEGRKGEEMVTAPGHELSHLVLRKTSSQFQRVQRPHRGDTSHEPQSTVPPTFSEGPPESQNKNGTHVQGSHCSKNFAYIDSLNHHNGIGIVLFILEGKKLRHN